MKGIYLMRRVKRTSFKQVDMILSSDTGGYLIKDYGGHHTTTSL